MISRRKFIFTSGVISGSFFLTSSLWKPLLANTSQHTVNTSHDKESFYRLSLFMTGRSSLNQTVSARALQHLSELDPDFVNKMHMLWKSILSANLTHVEQLMTSEFYQNESLKKVGQNIVSAWYLGFVGTPVALRAVDNTRFVTFTEALMYQPTIDATVIPTYSRGKTNYWINPPATILHD